VLLQVGRDLGDGHAIDARRPLVALDLLQRLHQIATAPVQVLDSSPDQSLVYFHVYRLFAQALSRRPHRYAWRPAFEISSMGARGVTAGTVKLLLPPRQSRGISLGY
jgi:hypothetical protein